MKTQLSKPARSKASYTEEYKQQALELWRASGRSAAKVAAELGIRPPLLYRWARTERPPGNSRKGDSHEHNTFFTSALHFDDGLRPAEGRPGSAAGRRHQAGARRG